MTKKIYLLSPDISWETFKLLQDKLVKDSGPTPMNADKALWNLLRTKKLYCWFGKSWPDDMGIGLEIPKGYKIEVISDGTKKNHISYRPVGIV